MPDRAAASPDRVDSSQVADWSARQANLCFDSTQEAKKRRTKSPSFPVKLLVLDLTQIPKLNAETQGNAHNIFVAPPNFGEVGRC
jgi:hypothetical protein